MIEIKFLADCKEHIPELAVLWYEEISRHWSPTASIARATASLHEHASHDQLPITLVAVQAGKAVGMASLRENDGIRPGLAPWLGSLVVDPKHRQQKIGEMLIEAIKRQAVRFDYNQMYLLAFDPTIPAWYARLGWKEVGTDKLFDHIVMVMKIQL